MKTLRCSDWPLLKKHLCFSEGDLVLAALNTYTDAFEACDEVRDAFDKYRFDCTGPFEETSKHMEEVGRLNKVYLSALKTQDDAYRALMNQLLGEEVYTVNYGR
jgi:hypothetical protein